MEPTLPNCCWPALALVGSMLGLLFVRCSWCNKRLVGAKRSRGGARGLSKGGTCKECIEKHLK
jgi:hypothetical protein